MTTKKKSSIWIGAIVGVLLVLYLTGRLDPLLYKVGLNYRACGQNGYGAVFCGQSLTNYNNRIQGIRNRADQALQTIQQQANQQQQALARAVRPPEGSSCTYNGGNGAIVWHSFNNGYDCVLGLPVTSP